MRPATRRSADLKSRSRRAFLTGWWSSTSIRTPAFLETYGPRAPVVEVGPYRLRSPFTRQDLTAALGAARDRTAHLESVGDPGFADRIKRGHTLTSADRFSYWLSNHYMLLFNLIVLVYVGVPFLAPVFMDVGWQCPAKIIYKIYSPLCHQLAYRSWFLFGEQPAYPRELAQVPGLISYEKATGLESSGCGGRAGVDRQPRAGIQSGLLRARYCHLCIRSAVWPDFFPDRTAAEIPSRGMPGS